MSGDWSTGRSADVGDLLDQVQDHHGVALVVAAMRADLRQAPEAWENGSLDRYLEALEALVEALDGFTANRDQQTPSRPSWHLVAEILVAASGYE